MNRFRIGVPAMLVLGWALLMGLVISAGPTRYPLPSRFNHDVSSPVLALELSSGREDIERVLPAPNHAHALQCRRAILVNTLLDFVFILLYVWYLVRLNRSIGLPGALRAAACALAVLTGIFDIVENAFILYSLRSGAAPIVIPSLAKWATLGIVLALAGRTLVGNHLCIYSVATDRLLGLIHLCAASLLLFGVIAGHWLGFSWIQHGSILFGATFLVTGLYIPVFGVRSLLRGQLVRYVDNFCGRRERGERVVASVQPQEPSRP
jgi:hypothetical protein